MIFTGECEDDITNENYTFKMIGGEEPPEEEELE